MHAIKIGKLIYSVNGVKLIGRSKIVKADVGVKVEVSANCYMVLAGFKVMGKGDKLWVKAPQIEYKNKEGIKIFRDIVQFEGDADEASEIWKRLSGMIIDAYEEKVDADGLDEIQKMATVVKVMARDKFDIKGDGDEDIVLSEDGWVNRLCK